MNFLSLVGMELKKIRRSKIFLILVNFKQILLYFFLFNVLIKSDSDRFDFV